MTDEAKKEKTKKGGKLKKNLMSIVVLFLLLIVVGVVAFNLYGDSLIRTGIEKGATAALKVDVQLENISTALLRGEVELSNLEIDNPEGYEHPTFIKLGHASMALDTGSLLSDTIVMDSMQFQDIEVVIEQKGLTNNLKEILNNLPQSDAPETETPTEESGGKNLRITELVITNVKVKANLLPVEGMARASTVTFPLKEIRMENIGTEEKVNVAELTGKILSAIATGIAEQGEDLLPIDMIGDITGELTKQGEELLKTGGELGKGVIDAGSDIGKDAAEALNNLNPFKSKKETTEEE